MHIERTEKRRDMLLVIHYREQVNICLSMLAPSGAEHAWPKTARSSHSVLTEQVCGDSASRASSQQCGAAGRSARLQENYGLQNYKPQCLGIATLAFLLLHLLQVEL